MKKTKYVYSIGESNSRVGLILVFIFYFMFGVAFGLLLSNYITFNNEMMRQGFICLIAVIFEFIYIGFLFDFGYSFWAVDKENLYYSVKTKGLINKLKTFIKYLLYRNDAPHYIAYDDIDKIVIYYEEVPGMYKLPSYSIFFKIYKKDKTIIKRHCINLTNQTSIADAFDYMKKQGVCIEDDDQLTHIMRNTTVAVVKQLKELNALKSKDTF